MTSLPTEALHFGDCHTRNADIGQRSAHVVEFEWLYDRGDQFHVRTLRRSFEAFIRINFAAEDGFAAFMPRPALP